MVRIEKRRGQRGVVIDTYYRKKDGTLARYRRDASVQSLLAAEREERRLRTKLAADGAVIIDDAGDRRSSTTPTFEQVAREYFEVFAPSHLKPTSIAGYQRVVNGVLIPKLGMTPIDRIEPLAIRQIDADLVRRGRSGSTRRNVQSVLRSILRRYCVEAGLSRRAAQAARAAARGRQGDAGDQRRGAREAIAAAEPHERLAIMLGAYAGLRAGELRGLRWCDVDLDDGHLVVRRNLCRGVVSTPKSGHERMVPIVPALRAELEAQKRGRLEDPVSRGVRGTLWPEYGLLKAFRSACKRAGVPSYRFHDLRHAFVTGVFRAGGSAPVVQALAGHLHLTTTQRYAHADRSDLAAAMAAFGARAAQSGS